MHRPGQGRTPVPPRVHPGTPAFRPPRAAPTAFSAPASGQRRVEEAAGRLPPAPAGRGAASARGAGPQWPGRSARVRRTAVTGEKTAAAVVARPAGEVVALCLARRGRRRRRGPVRGHGHAAVICGPTGIGPCRVRSPSPPPTAARPPSAARTAWPAPRVRRPYAGTYPATCAEPGAAAATRCGCPGRASVGVRAFYRGRERAPHPDRRWGFRGGGAPRPPVPVPSVPALPPSPVEAGPRYGAASASPPPLRKALQGRALPPTFLPSLSRLRE